MAERPPQATIVCFGDSVTQGTPHVRPEDAFPALLERRLNWRLEDCGVAVRVINSGVSGENASEGLARFEFAVLAHEPEVVIVEFGLNEARYDEKKRTAEEYQADLREIIHRCREMEAAVILTTPNPVIDAFHEYSRGVEFYAERGGCNRHLQQYVRAAREVGESEGVPVCDVYRAFEEEAIAAEFSGETRDYRDLVPLGPYLRREDGVHPTAAGQELIARALYGTLVRMGWVERAALSGASKRS
jgi:lysophospholipase L1-like esterase